jgi:hypothetical protein
MLQVRGFAVAVDVKVAFTRLPSTYVNTCDAVVGVLIVTVMVCPALIDVLSIENAVNAVLACA